MKPTFPANEKTESLMLGDHQATLYVWKSPDGTDVATHLILKCPNCQYPLSLAVSEFDFKDKTLHHKIRCPARWRKGEMVLVDDDAVFMADLNTKGKPSILRCNWTGHIYKGVLKHGSLDTTESVRKARSG